MADPEARLRRPSSRARDSGAEDEKPAASRATSSGAQALLASRARSHSWCPLAQVSSEVTCFPDHTPESSPGPPESRSWAGSCPCCPRWPQTLPVGTCFLPIAQQISSVRAGVLAVLLAAEPSEPGTGPGAPRALGELCNRERAKGVRREVQGTRTEGQTAPGFVLKDFLVERDLTLITHREEELRGRRRGNRTGKVRAGRQENKGTEHRRGGLSGLPFLS